MKEPEYYDADRWGIFSATYDEKKKKNKAPLMCYAGEDLLNAYSKSVPFLWGNILPESGLVCFAGESDCGKSAFLRQLAIYNCVPRSNTFLGQYFNNTRFYKSSLYISTEDNQHQFAATLGMQCKELNLEPRQLRGLKVLFESDDIIEKIERFQKEQHANLIIIDCLNDVLPTQATSAIAIRKFLSKLQHIAEEEHCLIIVSHHTNKYAHNRRPSKYNLIGSPAIEAKCRTVIEMRTDPFQRNYKHLCVVKGNYTPDSEKNRSYMLEFSPQLTFKNTSRRVDIDTLTLMPDYMADRVEKYNRLRSEGLKGDELAKAMGFASRGSLSVWAKKYIKNPQPDSTPQPSDPQPSDPQPSAPQPSDSQPSPDPKAPKDSKDLNMSQEPQPQPKQEPQPQPEPDAQPTPEPQPPPDPKDLNNPKDSKGLNGSQPQSSPPSSPSPNPQQPSKSHPYPIYQIDSSPSTITIRRPAPQRPPITYI